MHTHIFCHSLSVLVSNVNYACYIILQQEATNFYTSEYKQQQYYFRCAITAYYSGAVLGAWPLWLMYLLITAATLI